MALKNLVSLLAVATCALIMSSSTQPVSALSVDSHVHAARHVHHEAVAKRRRSSKTCRQRPTSSAQSSSAAKPTTTEKASSTPKSSPASTSDKPQSTGTGSSKPATGDSGGSSGNSGSSSSSGGLARGLAWAVDNNWAPAIADKPKIKWYHHWADGPVSQMDNIEFVPTYWGSSATDKWNQRVAEMKQNQPQHILGFNEPDISGQANMSPQDAANLWMQQIHPWGKKGVKLVSPQIAFDLTWLSSFKKAIEAQGGWFDIVAIHWYGGFKDLSTFQAYVQKAHSTFNLPIWIPELGITTESGASEADCLNFMQQALGWLESQSYVERVAWFGSFAQSNPPDGFATGNNALFYAENSLTSLGKYYGSSG